MSAGASNAKRAARPFDLLDWDSDCFGFPVARVHSGVDSGSLSEVVEKMRAAGIVLAYFSARADQPSGSAPARDFVGGSPVATRVNYALDLLDGSLAPPRHRRPFSGEIVEYDEAEADQSLISLSRESGAFSRFHVDPRIGKELFERIYDAWIMRSVRHEIAKKVFIARVGGQTVGLVTLADEGSSARIGLLSVDAAARGRGVGRALVDHASAWAKQAGYGSLHVATQVANTAACALYDSAGFAVESKEDVFHLWLTPG